MSFTDASSHGLSAIIPRIKITNLEEDQRYLEIRSRRSASHNRVKDKKAAVGNDLYMTPTGSRGRGGRRLSVPVLPVPASDLLRHPLSRVTSSSTGTVSKTEPEFPEMIPLKSILKPSSSFGNCIASRDDDMIAHAQLMRRRNSKVVFMSDDIGWESDESPSVSPNNESPDVDSVFEERMLTCSLNGSNEFNAVVRNLSEEPDVTSSCLTNPEGSRLLGRRLSLPPPSLIPTPPPPPVTLVTPSPPRSPSPASLSRRRSPSLLSPDIGVTLSRRRVSLPCTAVPDVAGRGNSPSRPTRRSSPVPPTRVPSAPLTALLRMPAGRKARTGGGTGPGIRGEGEAGGSTEAGAGEEVRGGSGEEVKVGPGGEFSVGAGGEVRVGAGGEVRGEAGSRRRISPAGGGDAGEDHTILGCIAAYRDRAGSRQREGVLRKIDVLERLPNTQKSTRAKKESSKPPTGQKPSQEQGGEKKLQNMVKDGFEISDKKLRRKEKLSPGETKFENDHSTTNPVWRDQVQMKRKTGNTTNLRTTYMKGSSAEGELKSGGKVKQKEKTDTCQITGKDSPEYSRNERLEEPRGTERRSSDVEEAVKVIARLRARRASLPVVSFPKNPEGKPKDDVMNAERTLSQDEKKDRNMASLKKVKTMASIVSALQNGRQDTEYEGIKESYKSVNHITRAPSINQGAPGFINGGATRGAASIGGQTGKGGARGAPQNSGNRLERRKSMTGVTGQLCAVLNSTHQNMSTADKLELQRLRDKYNNSNTDY